MENSSDPAETLRQVKNEIPNTAIDGGFKNIKYLNSGAIFVESCSEVQQKKLTSVLEKNQKIKLKTSDMINPMFMITGIHKQGYSNGEFVNELL